MIATRAMIFTVQANFIHNYGRTCFVRPYSSVLFFCFVASLYKESTTISGELHVDYTVYVEIFAGIYFHYFGAL